MKRFYERTDLEKSIIRCAYQFEIWAIENESSDTNPYYDRILAMEDGKEVWGSIDDAVSMSMLE